MGVALPPLTPRTPPPPPERLHPEVQIAVTGASGLVGSALVPALRDAGHDVVALVRRAPESPDRDRLGPRCRDDRGGVARRSRRGRAPRRREDRPALVGTGARARSSGAASTERCSSRGRSPRSNRAPRPRPGVGGGLLRPRRAPATEASPKGARIRGGRRRGVGGRGRARTARRDPLSSRCARGRCSAREGGLLGRDAPSVLARPRRAGRQRAPMVELAVAPGRRAGLSFALKTDLAGQVNVVGGSITNPEFTPALARALDRPTVPAARLRRAARCSGKWARSAARRPARRGPRRLREAGFAFGHTGARCRSRSGARALRPARAYSVRPPT